MNAWLAVILATLIGTGGTATVLQQPRAFSSDSQLLYRWSFDGPTATWASSGTATFPVTGISNNAAANMLFSGDSGSAFNSQNSGILPGIIGQSLFFTGLNNGMNGRATNVNLLGVSLMTVTMWVYPNNVLAWINDKMLIEGGIANWSVQTNAILMDTGTGSSRDFTIGIRDAVNTTLFLTKTFKATNAFTSSNIWYFCAFVFDNTTSAGNVKLLVNTTNITLTAGTSTKTSSVGGFGNHFWSFGNRGTLNLPFTGTLDDIRIYTNELTALQLSEIYTSSYNTILP
jgi:hypothetical protein